MKNMDNYVPCTDYVILFIFIQIFANILSEFYFSTVQHSSAIHSLAITIPFTSLKHLKYFLSYRLYIWLIDTIVNLETTFHLPEKATQRDSQSITIMAGDNGEMV